MKLSRKRAFGLALVGDGLLIRRFGVRFPGGALLQAIVVQEIRPSASAYFGRVFLPCTGHYRRCGRAFEVTREGKIVWEFCNPGWQGEERAGMYRIVRLPEAPSWLAEHTRRDVKATADEPPPPAADKSG